MAHLTVSSPEALDKALNDPNLEHLTLRQLTLSTVPAGLRALESLTQLTFDNCTLGGFDPAAFEAGAKSGKVEVEFMYTKFDEDALFQRALEHGVGNWRIQDYGFEYRRDPRWKFLAAIGDDFLGDLALRSAALALTRSSGAFPERPALFAGIAPTAHHLRLLDHGKKPVRDRAAAWLEKALPSPLTDGRVPEGSKVWVLGAPLNHDKLMLADRLAALKLTAVKSLKDATAILLLPRPGAKLADALASERPVLLEGHLIEGRAPAVSGAPAPEPAAGASGEQEAARLDQLLFNPEPGNVILGLSLAAGRPLTGALLDSVVAVAFFSQDAQVRKEGRALLLSHAPDALRQRLQGDKRSYASLEDGAKLTKLARELGSFGVDPERFTLAMLRMYAGRPDPYGGTFEPALEAALAFPGRDEQIFELLATQHDVYLPVKKLYPKGLSRLRALTKLRVYRVASPQDQNFLELNQLAGPLTLEYWGKDADLAVVARLAPVLGGLMLRGAFSNVSDVGPLAACSKLTVLGLEDTGVTDLSALSGLPLVSLNLSNTKLTSIEPLRGMRSLQGLFLSRFSGDLSPVASLTSLEHLSLGFTSITDLTLLGPLERLGNLDLWGTRVTDLRPLAGKPLTRLSLTHMGVKPDLAPLAEVPTLQALQIYGTPVDEAQIAALQAKLPNLYVSR